MRASEVRDWLRGLVYRNGYPPLIDTLIADHIIQVFSHIERIAQTDSVGEKDREVAAAQKEAMTLLGVLQARAAEIDRLAMKVQVISVNCKPSDKVQGREAPAVWSDD